MPRVNEVKKARKERQCGRCGVKIEVGQPYRYWEFRFGGTHVRCMKPSCSPRGSELTQSKGGEIMALNERLEDAIKELRENHDLDTFKDEVSSIKDDAESLRDEIQDGYDNMGEGLQQSDTGQTAESRVSALDDFINELDSAVDNITDPEDREQTCQDCQGDKDDAAHDQTQAAEAEVEYHEFNPQDESEVLAEAAEETASEFDGISCETD